MSLATACTNEQKVKIRSNPTTEGGQPASLDGGLQGEVLSGDGTVEPVPGEPNNLFLVSGPSVGQTQYRIFADADLGAGVVTIEDSATLDVGGAMAANFGLTADAPVPK